MNSLPHYNFNNNDNNEPPPRGQHRISANSTKLLEQDQASEAREDPFFTPYHTPSHTHTHSTT